MTLDSAYFHFRQRFTSAVYSGAVESIDSAFAYTKSAVIVYCLGTLDSAYSVKRSYIFG
jgi:hypothetical protein